MYLKRGIEHWNRWRRENPQVNPDFGTAYLCAGSLSAANLSQACLKQADLYSADLWYADLGDADLRSANLSSANLNGANCSNANFATADLIGANLNMADLNGANLHQANLSLANLSGTNLTAADLTGANLKGAKLVNVNLAEARLTGANLTGITISDNDLNLLTMFHQVACEHIYVLSTVLPDAMAASNTYTNCFRQALHQFYQSFVSACDRPEAQAYQVVWPSSTSPQSPDIYLQSVESQTDGMVLVRVGMPEPRVETTSQAKPNYQQLIHTLGRGDYYRHQLQLKERQIATYQRQNDELLELLKAMTRQNVYVQSVSVLENSIMTGVSKYDLRGANIGSFADTVQAGGQQRALQYNQSSMDTVPDWQIFLELEEIFDRLAHQATQFPPHQRPKVVANVLKKKAMANPDFKQRLFSAIESGSEELVRIFTHNPYISIPLSLVKGWVTAT